MVVTSTFPRWDGDADPGFVLELCKRLVEEGFEIDLLAPHAARAQRFEVMHGINICRYVYFFSRWQTLAYSGGIMAKLKSDRRNYLLVPFLLLAQFLAVMKHLRRGNYDLIHAHWLIPQGFMCALVGLFLGKSTPPILCTSHGSDIFALTGMFFINIKKWTVKRLSRLAVVSHYMRDVCMQLTTDHEKLTVCPMGVDLKNAFISTNEALRKGTRVIFVGRLIETKGIFHLLDALKLLVNEFPEIELLIVGGGPDGARLKQKAKELGVEKHIGFQGEVNNRELPSLYSSAAVAVVPSVTQEGLGLVTIEAMGCGCAVVASSAEAIKEVIENDKNGLLVKPGDAEQLASAIRLLLKDETIRQRLAAAGRSSVLEHYDWTVATDRYKQLIISLT